MKKSYRVDEVADALQVSRRTVERLIKTGELPSYKIGDTRTRRIDPDEVERLKKSGQNVS